MRYVIKQVAAGYFTEMGCVETRAVYLNGNLMGHENLMRPLFEAFRPEQASHFDTEQDALDLIANALYGAPEAFAGCTVEPTAT